MNQNYNQDSFSKGEAFEKFVEQTLFPDSHYELLHRTNTYDQNSKRYVGDSRKPDFRFKCILTGTEFHVEAKYRSKPFQGQYDILSEAQADSFPEIHQEECPIYIALGYGGTADNPAYVSFIPYEDHREIKIPVENVLMYQVPKNTIDSKLIYSPILETTSEIQTNHLIEEDATTAQNKQEETNLPLSKKRSGRTIAMGVAIALALITIVAGVLYFPLDKNDPYEIEMKSRIKNYYALSDANNLQKLTTYISPDMTFWYGLKNPSVQEVIDNIKEYRNKFPFSESSVDWTKFDVTPNPDGGYYAIYPLEYKVKSKIKAPYKVYDLKLFTVWDKDMKLVSIKEIRH